MTVKHSRRWVLLGMLLLAALLGGCAPEEETSRGEEAIPEEWEGYGSQTVVLFFAEGGTDLLWTEELRAIELQADAADRVQRCLEELFRGPEESQGRAFPDGAILQHVFIEDEEGVLTLDFSPVTAERISRAGSVEERVALGALRRTLRVNFPELRSVRILVGGESAETIGGHLSIARPLLLREDES